MSGNQLMVLQNTLACVTMVALAYFDHYFLALLPAVLFLVPGDKKDCKCEKDKA